MTTSRVPTVKLSNGVDMPQMSLGLAFWNVKEGGLEHNPFFLGFLPEQTYRALHLGLEAGIRGIDTALIYRSHPMIRSVLGTWFAEGKLKREDVFISTKVYHGPAPIATAGTHMSRMDSMSPVEVTEQVTKHLEQCLEELGLGYLDLVLIHWPAYQDSSDPVNPARRIAAWKVLEGYYERGWIRAIGVSNFSEIHLERLMKDGAKVKPMVNQVEASVYIQWDKIVAYCQENGILVEAFSPLGHGAANVVTDETVQRIAKKHQKDAGQIAMRYLIQKGYALTFTSSSEKRLRTNQDIFSFELDGDDMEKLNALNGSAASTGQPSPYDMS